MITIKKLHNLNTNQDFNKFIQLKKLFNNVVRFSYNRIIKNNITKQSELEQIVKKDMKNLGLLDSSWIKCAVKHSLGLDRDKKLYFGSKKGFFDRKYHKINTEETIFNKNKILTMRGSCNDKGNRKATIIDNTIIFKPYKGLSFEIKLNLSNNEAKMLKHIEEGSKNHTACFNISLSDTYIFISFEEPKTEVKSNYKKNRCLGIDLNPNYIALSIMDNTTEIYKELFDLTNLNKAKNTNSKSELNTLQQLSILNQYIVSLCKTYNVEYVCLEDLTMTSKNHGKGSYFNKLVNNIWDRNYVVNNLVKWLNINNIKYMMVNPFYTSFIGQMKYPNDFDSIAASKEIAFRGFNLIKEREIKRFKGFEMSKYEESVFERNYVNQYLSTPLSTCWKEMIEGLVSYKDLYNYFKSEKKSKHSYRFLFNQELKNGYSCFKLKDSKMIDLIRL